MEAIQFSALLATLKQRLAACYGSRLRGVYLFGSHARGEAGETSDVDVLIVLDEITRYGDEIERTGELFSELSLKYDTVVSRVFVSESTWKQSDQPFLKHIRAEAISL